MEAIEAITLIFCVLTGVILGAVIGQSLGVLIAKGIRKVIRPGKIFKDHIGENPSNFQTEKLNIKTYETELCMPSKALNSLTPYYMKPCRTAIINDLALELAKQAIRDNVVEVRRTMNPDIKDNYYIRAKLSVVKPPKKDGRTADILIIDEGIPNTAEQEE